MAEKDVQIARIGGMGEGGEVIRAMPERKHSFFQEVFANAVLLFPTVCFQIWCRLYISKVVISYYAVLFKLSESRR